MVFEGLSLILLTSGLVQLTFGVLLGWPVALFHTGLKTVGPIKNVRRLLQCHIDNLMMGVIQMALALVGELAPLFSVYLIVIGSWSNAQLFLVQACMGPNISVPAWLKHASVISFVCVTAGYVSFTPMVLQTLWF